MDYSEKWLRDRFNEFNQKYFYGTLDGKIRLIWDSLGRNLHGNFSIDPISKVILNRNSRKMFLLDKFDGQKISVDKTNFCSVCRPIIKINKNISGNEKMYEHTLLHEMIHYYTYKDGYVPKQAHGREFKYMALNIKTKSDGMFDIGTYHSNIDPNMDKETNTAVVRNTTIIIVKRPDKMQILRATNGTLNSVLFNITDFFERNDVPKPIYILLNKNINDNLALYNDGYRGTMRSYKYWDGSKMNKETVDNLVKNAELDSITWDLHKHHEFFKEGKEDSTNFVSLGFINGINLSEKSPLEMINLQETNSNTEINETELRYIIKEIIKNIK